MATWNNESKNTSVWSNIVKHGRDTRLDNMANLRFTDALFEDGTLVKDVTFAQLVDTVWVKANKSASPTWTSQSRN
jgi:hypothetical protein